MFVESREIFLLYCCQFNQDSRFITNKTNKAIHSLFPGEFCHLWVKDTVMMFLCYSKRPISPILFSS